MTTNVGIHMTTDVGIGPDEPNRPDVPNRPMGPRPNGLNTLRSVGTMTPTVRPILMKIPFSYDFIWFSYDVTWLSYDFIWFSYDVIWLSYDFILFLYDYMVFI